MKFLDFSESLIISNIVLFSFLSVNPFINLLDSLLHPVYFNLIILSIWSSDISLYSSLIFSLIMLDSLKIVLQFTIFSIISMFLSFTSLNIFDISMYVLRLVANSFSFCVPPIFFMFFKFENGLFLIASKSIECFTVLFFLNTLSKIQILSSLVKKHLFFLLLAFSSNKYDEFNSFKTSYSCTKSDFLAATSSCIK